MLTAAEFGALNVPVRQASQKLREEWRQSEMSEAHAE